VSRLIELAQQDVNKRWNDYQQMAAETSTGTDH